MKNPFPIFLVVLTFHSCSAKADDFADNWHQWRGPDSTGVSSTANPPTEWSEEKNVKWKVEIEGRGTSTPIIWGQKVFLLTAIDTGIKDSTIPDPQDQPKTNFFDIKRPNTLHVFAVLCLDRASGKELWRTKVAEKIPHEGAHRDNDFSPASPTTDGKHLYAWFGSAGMYCLDLNGNKIWSRDLGEVRMGSSLGEGCSPVLHDGKLLLVRDHAGKSSIEVLDASSGETLWKKDRDEGNAWATPRVIEHRGKTQVITAASGAVRSYDLYSGDIIWQCSGLTGNVIPCPVIDGDYVICMSGYQGFAAMALPLNAKGDISGSDQIKWKIDRGTPYIPSPLLYAGQLYCIQSNTSILTCFASRSGQATFDRTRVPGINNVYASPVGAAGRIYIFGRSGNAAVLKQSDEFELVATNRLDDSFDASPALAGNQLFLRGAKYLYCLEER
ncbi:MAG: PQQ-binding-like beta-propeller repeat protein [Planctomycetota bacterium]